MEAILDNRQKTFTQWFDEFLRRARINYDQRRRPPPHGVQESLAVKWPKLVKPK